MSKVSIDPATWSQARFNKLCTRRRCDRPHAVGVILILWARSRLGGLDIASRADIQDLLPVERPVQGEWFDALLEFGYVQALGQGGYIIEGNAEYFRRQDQQRAAGRARQAQLRAIAAGQIEKAPPRIRQKTPENTESQEAQAARLACWQAYAKAYEKRYRIKPARSAHTNLAIQHFVQRVGQLEAPSVIRFYVQSHDLAYMHAMHAVKLAVRDAEILLSKWRCGQALGAPDPSEHGSQPMRQSALWAG